MDKSLPSGKMPFTAEPSVGELGAAPETKRPQPVLITPKGRLIDDEAIDRAVAKARAKAVQRAVDRAKRRDQLRLWRSSR
jgi:hypothetical protein